MKYRKQIFFIAFFTFLLVAFLLITGSPVLVRPILPNSKIPAGTLITWLGIIALPLCIFFGIKNLQSPTRKSEKYISVALKIVIVFSLLWIPICYLLAGNLSFSFANKAEFQGSQTAMKIFWYFNYSMVGLPLVLLILFGIQRFIHKNNPADSKK